MSQPERSGGSLDTASWIGVLLCLVLLFAWNPVANIIWPPKPIDPAKLAAATNAPPTVASRAPDSAESPAPAPPEIRPAQHLPAPIPPPALERAPTAATAENDYIRCDFVAEGAGIRWVDLKGHRLGKGAGEDKPVRLNAAGAVPIFSVRGLTPPNTPEPPVTVSASSREVRMASEPFPGVTLTRVFTLQEDYRCRVELRFASTLPGAVRIPAFLIHCGTSAPLHEEDMPMYIGYDWWDGRESVHRKLTDFHAGSFLFIPTRAARAEIQEDRPLDWLTSRNQFFVTLVDPRDQPFEGAVAEMVRLPRFRPAQRQQPEGVAAWGRVPAFDLAGGATAARAFEAYFGPREYWRLREMGDYKHLVMDFGFWSWVSVPLLNTMNMIHKFTHNYGMAIILMVLVIKGLFFPLQSQSNKTMKQMQALQPRLKEVQEKHKDDPQKAQIEMMDLYREYGVNPLGGCLPVLIQIPVFFGFYSMLQSAVELRGASFLWAADLSRPDTVWHLPGFGLPVNPLPILMGLTSLWQMHITPTTTVDKTQATIMKFMPLMFVAICYNFSSALSLYWTVQNLFGVAQMYHNLNAPAPALEKKKPRPRTRWQMLMEQAREQAELERQKRRGKKG